MGPWPESGGRSLAPTLIGKIDRSQYPLARPSIQVTFRHASTKAAKKGDAPNPVYTRVNICHLQVRGMLRVFRARNPADLLGFTAPRTSDHSITPGPIGPTSRRGMAIVRGGGKNNSFFLRHCDGREQKEHGSFTARRVGLSMCVENLLEATQQRDLACDIIVTSERVISAVMFYRRNQKATSSSPPESINWGVRKQWISTDNVVRLAPQALLPVALPVTGWFGDRTIPFISSSIPQSFCSCNSGSSRIAFQR